MSGEPKDYEQEYQQVVIRERIIEKNNNGSNRIVWSVAAFGCASFITVFGWSLVRQAEMSDRLVRVETILEMVATAQGVKVPNERK